MFEVKSKLKEVRYGAAIRTFEREVFTGIHLDVEAGTTGFVGGDSSRTYLRIGDRSGTAMIRADLTDDGGFEVWLDGDLELTAFIKALNFAVNALEDQIYGVDD